MSRLFWLNLLLILTSLPEIARGQDSLFISPTKSYSVSVEKDPRIDLLIAKQIQVNEETSRQARRLDKGFRLLVISTSTREEALQAKTKVYSNFPELKAYLFHQTPYYKVKAGNFKERKEAETYQKKLEAFFPGGVFIMHDTIEVKIKIPGEEETPPKS